MIFKFGRGGEEVEIDTDKITSIETEDMEVAKNAQGKATLYPCSESFFGDHLERDIRRRYKVRFVDGTAQAFLACPGVPLMDYLEQRARNG